MRIASRALVLGRGGRRRGDEMTDPVSERGVPVTLARGDGAPGGSGPDPALADGDPGPLTPRIRTFSARQDGADAGERGVLGAGRADPSWPAGIEGTDTTGNVNVGIDVGTVARLGWEVCIIIGLAPQCGGDTSAICPRRAPKPRTPRSH